MKHNNHYNTTKISVEYLTSLLCRSETNRIITSASLLRSLSMTHSSLLRSLLHNQNRHHTRTASTGSSVPRYQQQQQQQQQHQQKQHYRIGSLGSLHKNNFNTNNYYQFQKRDGRLYHYGINNNHQLLRSNDFIIHRNFVTTTSLSSSSKKLFTTTTTTNNNDIHIEDAEIVSDKLQDMLQLLEKQSEIELNDNEKQLKTALQQLSFMKDTILIENTAAEDNTNTTTNNSRMDRTIRQHLIKNMEHVRDCYGTLLYWEYALEMEQNIEQVLVTTTSIDNDDEDDDNDNTKQNNNNNNINDDNDNQNKIAQSWYRQGKYYHRLQQYPTAQKLYDKSYQWFLTKDDNNNNNNNNNEEVWNNRKNHSILGSILLSMAGIQYSYTQNYSQAIELLQLSESYYGLAMTNNSPNSTVLIKDFIKCKKHLGLVFRTMEDYESALQQYQITLQLLEQHQTSFDNEEEEDDFLQEQGLLLDIADMYSALEQYDDAIRTFQIVLEKDQFHSSRRSMKNKSRNDDDTYDDDDVSAVEGIVYHNIGKIHAQQGQYDLSIDELQRAIAIKTRIGGELNSEVGKTFNLLGAVYATRARRRHQQQQQQDDDNHDDDDRTQLTNDHDFTAAYQCFQQALLIAKSNCPIGTKMEDDPEVQLAIQNLSKLDK